jgi:hypothetical protein
MTEEYTCSVTARSFPTAEAARASEARFRELQWECEAGHVPELRIGDVIYVESERYISHGCDDFQGGLAEVCEFRHEMIKGQPTPYVQVAQNPGALYSWERLAAGQKELRLRHGTQWAGPDPDLRPEFNGYFL